MQFNLLGVRETLCESGTDVNARVDSGQRALDLAITATPDFVRLLLRYDALVVDGESDALRLAESQQRWRILPGGTEIIGMLRDALERQSGSQQAHQAQVQPLPLPRGSALGRSRLWPQSVWGTMVGLWMNFNAAGNGNSVPQQDVRNRSDDFNGDNEPQQRNLLGTPMPGRQNQRPPDDFPTFMPAEQVEERQDPDARPYAGHNDGYYYTF